MPDLRRPRPPRALVLVAFLAAGVLAGCGDDGGAGGASAPDPATSSSPGDPATSSSPGDPATSSSPGGSASSSPSSAPGADAPDCAAIWTTGDEIPRGYDGCDDGGSLVEADVLGCSSGQRFVTFGDRWYGVLGGTVREGESPLGRDREYRASVASCRA